MSELKLPELFGSRVFNEETMKERLSGRLLSGVEALRHRWSISGIGCRQ